MTDMQKIVSALNGASPEILDAAKRLAAALEIITVFCAVRSDSPECDYIADMLTGDIAP